MSTGTTDLPVDPFRDREATNYENPIPSREMLLEVIRALIRQSVVISCLRN